VTIGNSQVLFTLVLERCDGIKQNMSRAFSVYIQSSEYAVPSCQRYD